MFQLITVRRSRQNCENALRFCVLNIISPNYNMTATLTKNTVKIQKVCFIKSDLYVISLI